MKESKAELVKRLEKIFAVEDDFPGYLGNPQSLGAFMASVRRPPPHSRRRVHRNGVTRRRKAVAA